MLVCPVAKCVFRKHLPLASNVAHCSASLGRSALAHWSSDPLGSGVQGMSLMDFFHLRDQIWPAHTGDPTVNNTVLLEGVKELRTEADVAWLKKDLDAMSTEPVVYLGNIALAYLLCHTHHSLV